VEILYYRKDLFESTAEQKNFKAKYGYDLALRSPGSSSLTPLSSSLAGPLFTVPM